MRLPVPVSLSTYLALPVFLTKKLKEVMIRLTVEWLDLIGDMAYQKRNLVFSLFLALKTPFFDKEDMQCSAVKKFF